MSKRINKIRNENLIYKTDGDVLYFINCIRNFLGLKPIVNIMKIDITNSKIFEKRKKTIEKQIY